jgi:hypothetical protein
MKRCIRCALKSCPACHCLTDAGQAPRTPFHASKLANMFMMAEVQQCMDGLTSVVMMAAHSSPAVAAICSRMLADARSNAASQRLMTELTQAAMCAGGAVELSALAAWAQAVAANPSSCLVLGDAVSGSSCRHAAAWSSVC